jgi:hypothetical protein
MQDNKLELFKTHNPLETLSCSFKKKGKHMHHIHTHTSKNHKRNFGPSHDASLSLEKFHWNQ